MRGSLSDVFKLRDRVTEYMDEPTGKKRIVTYVRNLLRRLDSPAQRVQPMIEKLRDCRQELVTAAVTSQLDVTSETGSPSTSERHAEAIVP